MNTYSDCQRCGKFGGTVASFSSHNGETLNARFICPYCLDEDKEIRADLLSTLIDMVDLWKRYCEPRNVEFDSQVRDARAAISRAEGSAAQ